MFEDIKYWRYKKLKILGAFKKIWSENGKVNKERKIKQYQNRYANNMEIQKIRPTKQIGHAKIRQKFYWYKNVEAEEHVCKYKILETMNLKNKN